MGLNLNSKGENKMAETTSDKQYKIHKLCGIIPRPTEDEINHLVDSMKKDGYINGKEIVLLDGEIIDGWSRYEASVNAGIDPTFRDYNEKKDGELVSFVRRENLDRRQLPKDAWIKGYLDLAEHLKIQMYETELARLKKEEPDPVIRKSKKEELVEKVKQIEEQNLNTIAEKTKSTIQKIRDVKRSIENSRNPTGDLDAKRKFEDALHGKGKGRPTAKASRRAIDQIQPFETKTISKRQYVLMKRKLKWLVARSDFYKNKSKRLRKKFI